jgi:hypothetical protein
MQRPDKDGHTLKMYNPMNNNKDTKAQQSEKWSWHGIPCRSFSHGQFIRATGILNRFFYLSVPPEAARTLVFYTVGTDAGSGNPDVPKPFYVLVDGSSEEVAEWQGYLPTGREAKSLARSIPGAVRLLRKRDTKRCSYPTLWERCWEIDLSAWDKLAPTKERCEWP